MRYFALLNWQHVLIYVFPTLVLMVVFYLALGVHHLHSDRAEERKHKITHVFPGHIEDRDAPFPLAMILIIAGTLVWMVAYIVGTGVLGAKI